MKRKICVVTGSRAEYGLLTWLMRDIAADPDLELQIAVTGMHLSPEFGLTWKEIEADGFSISRKIEMLLSSDTPVGIVKSMALGQMGLAEAFADLRPDIVVLLGDRFEILAAASAALILRIPVAHLHGGEATEGAFDDSIRHAVTKMSHLHFASAEAYRKRILPMGERPERTFNVGALGFEAVRRLEFLDKPALERSLEFVLGQRNFLVTFHPATLGEEKSAIQVGRLLEAFEKFPDAHFIFTLANADTEGREINRRVKEFAENNPKRAKAFSSLGQLRYLSAMRHVDAVVGNSSSGIIEAPWLGVPTVNIGDRQKGRIRALSIIDCEPAPEPIFKAMELACSEGFRAKMASMENPYGDGKTAARIVEILKTQRLEGLIQKGFHDF